MRKKWTIGNGWKKQNAYGLVESLQITPEDFDPNFDRPGRPYRELRDPNGGCVRGWQFQTKRDRDAAAQRLSDAGWSA